jgi:hypothetical protein
LGSFGGAQRAPKLKKQHKKLVSGCFGLFHERMGLIISVRGLFLSLVIVPYVPPTCRALGIFLGPFGGTQKAPKWEEKKKYKNLSSGCFAPFLLKEHA